MLFYSLNETVLMVLAAIVVDWIIGDPVRGTHPVLLIGKLISWLEKRLRGKEADHSVGSSANPSVMFTKGVLLVIAVCGLSFGVMWLISFLAFWIHPWLGYAVQIWFISTTIAIKGLKDSALLVYKPLQSGQIGEARKYVGYIVGRNTEKLDEKEVTRATVETVAENIVDAMISPLFYAFLGGAPLALLYRATNTLDSMVGYKNEKYLYFGRASARWDDVLNWIPARLTGICLVIVAWLSPFASAKKSLQSVITFAHLHPSPNSGIPESAVAGALGIQLGGVNDYGGKISERARMGWPMRQMISSDILYTTRLLYGVSYLVAGGLLCVLLLRLFEM
ncbi:adenosylcobinamide-phosphate synthase CbiB [Brevibacillus ginsengisoli]|uniref:adenosylcobinamide-phosphate synthase CbiB n=1 Tax=Brevibacillus ginsengisoli TaxID=363854 RepID=UPI003CF9D6BE